MLPMLCVLLEFSIWSRVFIQQVFYSHVSIHLLSRLSVEFFNLVSLFRSSFYVTIHTNPRLFNYVFLGSDSRYFTCAIFLYLLL